MKTYLNMPRFIIKMYYLGIDKNKLTASGNEFNQDFFFALFIVVFHTHPQEQNLTQHQSMMSIP